MTAATTFFTLQLGYGSLGWDTAGTSLTAGLDELADAVLDHGKPEFRVIGVDLANGTARDATIDLLKVFAAKSIYLEEVPPEFILSRLEAAGVPHWTREDDEAAEASAAQYQSDVRFDYRMGAL
jgi:hypothetical protein